MSIAYLNLKGCMLNAGMWILAIIMWSENITCIWHRVKVSHSFHKIFRDKFLDNWDVKLV